MSAVEFCGECWGQGFVLCYFDNDDECCDQTCAACKGSGHWDAETSTPVSGPCTQAGCVGCNP